MQNNNLINKQTGERVSIIKEDSTYYVLSDNVSIKKDILTKKYDIVEEAIDPNSFFQAKSPSNDPLMNMAQQLKNIDTSRISDSPSVGAQVKFIEPPVTLSDNSMSGGVQTKAQQIEESITLTPEQKRQMLAEWRDKMPGANIESVQNKNWDEEDEKFLNGDKPIVPKVAEKQVDPIKLMFKMFKSNYPVKINVVIEEQIPNPTFIGMVQENVEADAVEYYANLISEKILSEPSKLKEEIYNQLKLIIDEELKK